MIFQVDAADAGVVDALWKIKNDASGFLEPYTIADINGLSVDVDVDEINTIAGETVDPGNHAEWLVVGENITYDADIYGYTLSVSNNGSGNIKVLKILIEFPPGVDYEDDSTVSEILDVEPQVNSTEITGLTIIWEGTSPNISAGETAYHYFELNGPSGIEGIEGYGILETQREDVGTVWISDVRPYSIMAQAKDASETVVASIRAGVWEYYGALEVSCWQVIR
ncbi:hypothetical protein ACFLV0_02220 [Chloroflexota bacterium]